jgi:hypothetical protein
MIEPKPPTVFLPKFENADRNGCWMQAILRFGTIVTNMINRDAYKILCHLTICQNTPLMT